MRDNLHITESRMNAYNAIAPWYDWLSRLIFGKSIKVSQTKHIDLIPPDAQALVLGGGTGWLLETLLRAKPGCRWWYLDSSSKMIELARRKSGAPGNVRFIHGKLDAVPQEVQFDVVIANFFFDQFTEKDLKIILNGTYRQLKPGGLLLVTDFVNDRAWMKWSLEIMYTFFRIIRAIEIGSLPPWDEVIRLFRFRPVKESSFYRGFIRSMAYKK